MNVKTGLKKFFAIALVLSMISQMIPVSMYETKAADTSETVASGQEYTNIETDVKFKLYKDISQYRGTDKTYPKKEGYIFAGWYTGVTEAAKDSLATPISTDTTSGSAWAKFVPEEVLSVKAQVSHDITSVSENQTVKLRLVTTVDSMRYNEVGFKIKFNGSETENPYGSQEVYNEITVADDYGRKWTETPSDAFHKASIRFATVKITGFTKALFTTYELAVTPYWITKDGTTVTGVSRERILVSDDMMTYSDGSKTENKEDFSIGDDKKTYTFENDAIGTTASYKYFEGGSDTVYLKGKYTPSSASGKFGITIRNGGETRQVLFSNAGVLVIDGVDDNGTVTTSGLADRTAYDAYDDVMQDTDKGVYVWASKVTKELNTYTANTSAIKTMLGGNTATEVVWAIENNVLYCSVAGEVVLRLPMNLLCEKWQKGRYYQLGLAAYNESANGNGTNMKFQNTSLLFGKDALQELNPEKGEVSTKSLMEYEPIYGSYMSASAATNAAYAYGEPVSANTPISMSVDLKWQDITNSGSGAGFTIKSGNETRQIYFQYGEGTNYQIRCHKSYVWSGQVSVKTLFYANPYGDLTNCNIKAYIYDEKLSVLINGQTAFESLLNSDKLFGDSYSAENKISLGIATWDGLNGQPLFQNVKFETGNSVISEKVADWTVYPESKGANISLDTKTGNASKTTKGYEQLTFTGTSDVWEVTGTMSHAAQNLQGFWITNESESTYIRILGQNKGFGYVPGWKWTYNGSGVTEYCFQPHNGYFNSAGAASVDFKAVIAHDTLYVWLDGKFSWMIPLTESMFGGFAEGTEYKLKLDFGETAVATSFESLKVLNGAEVDISLVRSLQQVRDLDWAAANAMMTLTETGKIVTINKAHTGDQYIYSKANSDTIYLSGTWEYLTDKALVYGVTLKGSDGKNRQVRLHNQGVAVLANNTWLDMDESGAESIFKYNTIKDTNPYVWAEYRDGVATSTIATTLASLTGAKHQFVWAVRDNTLYCNINGFTCVALPLDVICSSWTKDSGVTYQIGLSKWNVKGEGDVAVSDVSILYGDAAEQKFVDAFTYTSKITGPAMVTNENSVAKGTVKGAIQATLSGESDVWEISGTMRQEDLKNRLDQGIKIECGNKYLTLYGQHYGVVAISHDRGWTNAWTHNNSKEGYDFIEENNANYHEFFKQPDVAKNILRSKNTINYTIKIVNDTVYGWFDDVLIWKIDLTDTYFGAFEAGSTYKVSLMMNQEAFASSFENVKVLKGTQVDPEISVSEISGNP